MDTVTTNNSNFLVVMPKAYKQQGNCPHCGAGVYVDAACFKGKKLITLPVAYYSCTCRLTFQPNVAVPWAPSPNPFPPLMPQPWTEPQITWTVKAPTVTCVPNTTNAPTTPTTAQPNTLDWRRFTETGGITQHPDLTKNIICINACSPLSMASGAMASFTPRLDADDTHRFSNG